MTTPHTQHDNAIRSGLSRAKGLGSARDGTHHWWMQRLTAIGLAPLVVWLFACPSCYASRDYASVVVWLGQHSVAIPLILFLIGGYYHAALGVQTVVEDYVHDTGWKMALLVLTRLLCFALAVVSIYAVLFINYGIYG